MNWRIIRTLVIAVNLGAVLALAALPAMFLRERTTETALIAVLAALSGCRPVRVPSTKTEFVATHPFPLLALAVVGPVAAAIVALAGVVGAAIARDPWPQPIRFAFNAGATVLAMAVAGAAFLAAGGAPGLGVGSLLLPLFLAAAVNFLVSTLLIALPICLETRRGYFATWVAAFLWTPVADLAGLTIAIAMAAVMDAGLFWVALLGLPSCWLLTAFYAARAIQLAGGTRAT